MAIYIQSDDALNAILAVEGVDSEAYIRHQVEQARKGVISVIEGGDLESKYIINRSGEIHYSCAAGDKVEIAQQQGFGITF